MVRSNGERTGRPSGRSSETEKQARTWLVPEPIEQIRDACLDGAFRTHLQDRNETIVVVLADTGLRVGASVALDWSDLDLDADPAELFLPPTVQKSNPGASYPSAEPVVRLEPSLVAKLIRLPGAEPEQTERSVPGGDADPRPPR